MIQSDALAQTDSLPVRLIATTLQDAPLHRLDLAADQAAGLHRPSQVMVDKIVAVRRERCGVPIGRSTPRPCSRWNGGWRSSLASRIEETSDGRADSY